MSIEQTLKTYGLTDEETALYLAGLKTGEAPLARIAKNAGIKRPTAYSIAKSLEAKGLMGNFKMRSGLRFVASPPSTLAKQLERKKEEVEKILPELSALSGKLQTKPKITFYEGEEGYFTILEDSLETKNDVIRAIGSLGKIYEVVTEEYDHNHYIPTRVKNNTKYRALHFQWESAHIFTPEKNAKELREQKFLPEKYMMPNYTLIYRNIVSIFTSKKEMIAIRIESEEIAESERKRFDLIWDLIK
jgi:HTH-type transcriptional regulator, sugar sensing transcriptional regulator